MLSNSTESIVIASPPLNNRRAIHPIPGKCSFRPVLVSIAVLIVCFPKPLYDLVWFSLSTDLFSHILLIPFISGYLVWQAKDSLPAPSRLRSIPLTLGFLGLGLVSLGAWIALKA